MQKIWLNDCAWDKANSTLTYGQTVRQDYTCDTHYSIKSHVSGKEYFFRYKVVFIVDPSKKVDPEKESAPGFWVFEPEDKTCPIKELFVYNKLWDGEPFVHVLSQRIA